MYIKKSFLVLTLISLLTFFSCRDDFDYSPLNSNLEFSSNIISVDTVYNFSKSDTYVLKVYNPENKNVVIPRIYLSKGDESFFNINVDGKSGSNFKNITINKKDSLYIFIEVSAKEAPSNPLYTDEINFESENSTKKIKLLSWIEKAKIHAKDAIISSGNWNSSETQVIDGNLTITNDLTIDKGTTIYFKKGASIIIGNNAKLSINGALGEEVKFRSVRHDYKYDSIPNQWNKIELSPKSTSKINYAKIIGGNTGLYVNNASLEISNTKIVNNQSFGILANNSSITGYNLILNNSNLASLAIESGGNYEFYHSTFANYFNFNNYAGPAYSLYISNTDSNNNTQPLIRATFGNCIIYNQRTPNAIAFSKENNNTFNYLFDTNIIHNTDTSIFNASDDYNFISSIIKNPAFINPDYRANKLAVEENSPAKKAGKLEYAKLFPLDYTGNSRVISPTIGAIQ